MTILVKIYPATLKELFNLYPKIPKSEHKVYSILGSLGDKWSVWYSIEWITTRGSDLGESDFLAFHPDFGFIVLEVKGGGINVIGKNWTTTNMNGEQKIKDPFIQARRSAFFFSDYYREVYNQLFPALFSYAVVFPDCDFKENAIYPPNVLPEMIFDASDFRIQKLWDGNGLSPMENFLMFLFSKIKEHLKTSPPPDFENLFSSLITPDISIPHQMQLWLEIQNENLDEINQVQDYLLDAISEIKNVIFCGSAGTGKTFFAMKKFKRCIKQGHKTLFLCYNRELIDFIRKTIAADIPSFPDDSKIVNIHSFIYTILQASLDYDEFENFKLYFEAGRYDLISKKILEISETSGINLKYKFDALIIDEAQDIEENLWKLFKYLLNDEINSIYYIFFDESQKIFNKNFTPILFGFPENTTIINLNRNLRNVDKISRWFAKTTKLGHYEQYLGIQGISVFRDKSEDLKIALDLAVRHAFELYVKRKIKLESMIVLCDKKMEYLEKSVPYHVEHFLHGKFFFRRYSIPNLYPGIIIRLVEPEKNIFLPEIQALSSQKTLLYNGIGKFKGLEQDIVFLVIPDITTIPQDQKDDVLMKTYIGASRAKFMLHVIEYAKI